MRTSIKSLSNTLMAKFRAYRGVRCVIGTHPSFLKSVDGEKTTIPTLMMPAVEDNLTVYLAGVLRNKTPKLVSVSENYLCTFHGFLGGRGEWEKPDQKPNVDRAKEELSAFLATHLNSSKTEKSAVPVSVASS